MDNDKFMIFRYRDTWENLPSDIIRQLLFLNEKVRRYEQVLNEFANNKNWIITRQSFGDEYVDEDGEDNWMWIWIGSDPCEKSYSVLKEFEDDE